MIRGALWGTIWGILGACLGWMALCIGFAIQGDPSALTALPLFCLFTAGLATPGAFLLGLPLVSFLLLVALNVASRPRFFAIAMAAGSALGLVNLVLSLVLLRGGRIAPADVLGFPWFVPALAGGISLGFGVARVVRREAHRAPLSPGWRGPW